jgi:hypothetical protein
MNAPAKGNNQAAPPRSVNVAVLNAVRIPAVPVDWFGRVSEGDRGETCRISLRLSRLPLIPPTGHIR